MRKLINYCGSYFGSLEEVTRWRLAQSRDRAHTHQYGGELLAAFILGGRKTAAFEAVFGNLSTQSPIMI